MVGGSRFEKPLDMGLGHRSRRQRASSWCKMDVDDVGAAGKPEKLGGNRVHMVRRRRKSWKTPRNMDLWVVGREAWPSRESHQSHKSICDKHNIATINRLSDKHEGPTRG